MGVNFFRVKNDQTGGGGPRGVWQKTILFHVFFFEPFPYMNFLHCTGDYEDDKVIVFGYPVIDLDLKAGDDNGE